MRGRVRVSDALSLGLQPLGDLPCEQRLVMRCGPGCSKGSGIGHLGGGSLEQPRPRLGAQWAGLSPWERRAARSRQARAEEARQPELGHCLRRAAL